MIPHMHIIAWSNDAPWASLRQIEQDLIISRSVIDIFNDDFLADELRFRGGTALNKLHFPQALRYSEDIDLVRTSEGPIGPVLDHLREALGWLGQAQFEQSPVAPKLIYHVDADDGGPQVRLKIEINTREREAYDAPVSIPHAVDNPWFTGQADVVTYSREELLATKLRALLQRDQGRDLFDLARALENFEGLDKRRVVETFVRYLALQGLNITRAGRAADVREASKAWVSCGSAASTSCATGAVAKRRNNEGGVCLCICPPHYWHRRRAVAPYRRNGQAL